MAHSGGGDAFLARPTTVLVTGGCGFIGHHLVRRLLNAGHRVIVLDDLSTGVRSNLPVHPHLRFRLGSVLDAQAVAAASRTAALVVHLAGVVGMRLATRLPEVAYTTSLVGTRNVLGASKAPVVAVSSSAVYGLDGGIDTDESRSVPAALPLGYDGGRRGYAAGKWMLERLALRASRAGRSILTVRPFNVVGSGQRGAYGMVLPRFVEHARHGRAILVYGDGTQTRSFCDVETFVDVLVRLIRSPAAWQSPATPVNIGNPIPTSILELASVVRHVTETDAPIRFAPYESIFPGKRDVLRRTPCITRLEALIGGVDWPDLQTIVRRVCESEQVASEAADRTDRSVRLASAADVAAARASALWSS